MSADEQFFSLIGSTCLIVGTLFLVVTVWKRGDDSGYLFAALFYFISIICSIPWWPGVTV